jgi:hypothetical protein
MLLFVNENQPAKLESEVDFNVKKIFPLLQTPLLNKLIGNAQPAAYHLFEKLNALIDHHAGYRYTTAYGNVSSLRDNFTETKEATYTSPALDRYPLREVWREFYHNEISDFPTLLQLLFALSTQWGESKSYKVHEFMNREFLPEIKKFYGFDLRGLKNAIDKLPYLQTIQTILQLLGEAYWDAPYANTLAGNILTSFSPLLDKGNARKEFIHETYTTKERRTVFLFQHSSIYYWMSDAFGSKDSTNGFTEYFTLRYSFYQKADYLMTNPPAALTKTPLSVFDFAHAYALELISEEEMLQELQTRVNAEESLSLASAFLAGTLKPWQRNRLAAYGPTDFAMLKDIVGKVAEHILDVELRRGEHATDASRLVMKLERIEGAGRWVDILKALGNEPFGKADPFYNPDLTRKEALSRLLRICHPAPEDTAENLAQRAKQAGISTERLMEAALYAPQWLEIVEACIGWKGLQNAAYFLHAHTNDRCNDLMKARIARYSPISPNDLCAGAFDVNWFRDALRETGNRRFDKLFHAARNISSGNEYARFASYIDAINGETSATLVRKQVEEKRDRDLLMMYGLIPLSKRSNNDLIKRYFYLRQFLKETKAFGSQRQEYEKRAVELSLINLALNAGYTNVNRLIWHVETITIQLLQPCLATKEKGDLKICMKVNAAGKPNIHYFKAGKELANIPGKLRKDPCVRNLRETCKQLRSTYAHTAEALEQMMEEGLPLPVSELNAFRTNPFLWPLLKRLVFVADDSGATGFYAGNGLLATNDAPGTQEPATTLRIAHPADLQRRETADSYRADLQRRGTDQPFEQLARAYYAKTEEEQTAPHLLRYAGKRIHPSQATARLKARRWRPVGTERWQKVYRQERIAAILETRHYALSPTETDIFSPERILFFERQQNTPLPLADVPDRIFSEVVRDIASLFDN